ncbi:MAG: hypothetical protein A2Z37_16195 [Chloroflexi bacterium RBG_19FT_COMBO_62_14]|nr:MAG: hypothetical protein A2Z37_16195 [Chloroflexi bacterium RBG_19FT_COMBO_62_14]
MNVDTSLAAIVIGAALLLVILLNVGLVIGGLRSRSADGIRKWLGAARRLGNPWAEEDQALQELHRRVSGFEASDKGGGTKSED